MLPPDTHDRRLEAWQGRNFSLGGSFTSVRGRAQVPTVKSFDARDLQRQRSGSAVDFNNDGPPIGLLAMVTATRGLPFYLQLAARSSSARGRNITLAAPCPLPCPTWYRKRRRGGRRRLDRAGSSSSPAQPSHRQAARPARKGRIGRGLCPPRRRGHGSVRGRRVACACRRGNPRGEEAQVLRRYLRLTKLR